MTSIGNSAFSGCSSLTAITIPEGVTSIGNYAFSGCSLTSITIPEGVTSIGNYAFGGCTSLKEVVIEDGSTTLSLGYNGSYQGLFYDCPLEKVYLGRNLSYSSGQSYGYSPFYNKDALTNVVISNDVTEIGQYAFYGCDNLHSLTIGSGVLSIGSSAFSTPEKVIWLTNTPPTGYANAKGSINYVANDQYTSLSNVKVYSYLSSMFEVDGVKYVPVSPAERTCDAIDCAYDSTATVINVSETASFRGIAMTVKEVMPYTFYGNKHIKEVSVSHKGNIGSYAFYDCDSIQSVELSNEGNVSNQAFYDCDNLKTLNISNIGNVGDGAFRDCGALETAIVTNSPKETPSTTPAPQPTTFADWTSTNHSDGSTSSETYTFTAGAGATLSFDWSVSSEANYDKLIVILDGTIILEKSGSLSGTYNNAISQGEHTLVVKYTKDGSSSNGSDQASVSNIVVSVGSGSTVVLDGAVCNSAFYDCVSLKSVTLGDKVTSLGDDAFRGCTSLQEIVIPDSVKSVGTYCFYGCTAMKNVMLGNGLTDVKEYTFANCSELDSVKIGNGVTAINGYAFSGCSSLKDIEFGDSVATINNYAFQGCSSLSAFTIPQTVTTVGDYVFAGCSNLADVIIADRTTALALGSNGSSSLFIDCPLDSVYIGGQITYSTSPFYRNTSLRTAVISDRETQVYANEFFGCTALKNVTIGNGVSSIGDYAFSGCSSLEGFSFGSNMESIGAEAFSDCTNLTSITSHAAVPPTCGTQALDDINKWNCTLRVPSGYAAAYMAADQWKEFFFVEDVVEVEKYTLTFTVDGEVYHTDTLAHKAAVTMPETPEKEGYTFSGWSDTLTVMPAEDVAISGAFAINKYLVTFKIGEDTVAVDTFEYAANIIVPEAPEKEGHTFNGWNEVDETVPAHDVTYEGTYTVNSYLLTFVVDGETLQSDSIAYGTAITLPEVPTKKGYAFDGWSDTLTVMPAENVTISGIFIMLPMDNFVIRDSESSFTLDEELECDTVTYLRTFDDTEWQVLYVPFEIPYEAIGDSFEVADINDIRQYDNNADGVKDETVIEAFKVTSGVLEANYPYLIRAKVAGEKTIAVVDATLYATEENAIDCSSVHEMYTFTGTYNTLSSAELTEGEGYYTLVKGVWQPVTANTTLGAFRFYLKVDSRDSDPVTEARSIRMRIVSEDEGSGGSTSIDSAQPTSESSEADIYDLSGRKLEVSDLRELAKGTYIVGGVKMVVK